jgi:hypothetical protein
MADNIYGPNTAQVERLLARVRALTPEEAERMAREYDDARYSFGITRSNALVDAAWTAARRAGLDVEMNTALNDVRSAAWRSAWYGPRSRTGAAWAAQDAVCALVVRDLVSKTDFDVIAGPWASVIGATWEDDRAAPHTTGAR